MTRINIAHAYSKVNSGDELLVRLTIDQVRNAIPGASLAVTARDPGSFGGKTYGGAVSTWTRASAGRTPRSYHREWETGSAIVAVGGGYMRAGTAIEAAKTALVHLPQLTAAARSSKPTIYLPQSIGPFRGPIGRRIKQRLNDIDTVFARDDRTVAELGNPLNVHRVPDLAVMELAHNYVSREGAASTGASIVIVARQLASARYIDSLRALHRILPNAIWAAQSVGRGNDDIRFYREQVGIEGKVLTTQEALQQKRVGCVIAGRLHGAMAGLLAGIPAIHLGYERKSFGAYDDMGLSQWMKPAAKFEAEEVASLATELAQDSRDFWLSLEGSLAGIRMRRAEMAALLERTILQNA